MNILILHSQVPFVRGGAEVLVDGLASAISDRGHDLDVVSLPLGWNPPEKLLSTALAWRLLDVSRSNERFVDLVICTKFPTWAVDHPRKALWLIHQHRQAYDLHGTPMSEFGTGDAADTIRERIVDIDRIGIASCDPRHTISRNVSDRLRRFTGLDASPLYPPVPRAGLRAEAYEPFVLSVARLDASKRVGALVEAWPMVLSALRLVIVGDGPDRAAIERRVAALGISDRVSVLGRVDDARLRDLYNTCRAVFYAPIDEDYGYTTVESLAAGKPVITSPDSGGVLEFVGPGMCGAVTELAPRSLACAIDAFADEKLARALGSGGPAVTAALNWDTVVSALVKV
ncbi:MAG TPA: glycosyltransferase family 4 protein [Thermomicrobiales bacterium]|nr:glycosyltransferase family 4 protein [Thermomicrobiales bacterium]